MNRFAIFVAFTSVLTAGCESLQYNPPPGRPVATLTFRNAVGSGEVVMNAFQTADCRDAGKYVANSELKPGGEAKLTAEAGRPFSFRVQSKRPVTGNSANVAVPGLIRMNVCDAAGTFEPRVGGKYSVIFTDANDACQVAVLDDATSKTADTFVAKRWFVSTTSDGWHCNP